MSIGKVSSLQGKLTWRQTRRLASPVSGTVTCMGPDFKELLLNHSTPCMREDYADYTVFELCHHPVWVSPFSKILAVLSHFTLLYIPNALKPQALVYSSQELLQPKFVSGTARLPVELGLRAKGHEGGSKLLV